MFGPGALPNFGRGAAVNFGRPFQHRGRRAPQPNRRRGVRSHGGNKTGPNGGAKKATSPTNYAAAAAAAINNSAAAPAAAAASAAKTTETTNTSTLPKTIAVTRDDLRGLVQGTAKAAAQTAWEEAAASTTDAVMHWLSSLPPPPQLAAEKVSLPTDPLPE